MKIQCTISHECGDEDCGISIYDGKTGYIEVSNLDELIRAKDTDEFEWRDSPVYCTITIQKSFLTNFSII